MKGVVQSCSTSFIAIADKAINKYGLASKKKVYYPLYVEWVGLCPKAASDRTIIGRCFGDLQWIGSIPILSIIITRFGFNCILMRVAGVGSSKPHKLVKPGSTPRLRYLGFLIRRNFK